MVNEQQGIKTIFKAKTALTEVNAAFVSLGRSSHGATNVQQILTKTI